MGDHLHIGLYLGVGARCAADEHQAAIAGGFAHGRRPVAVEDHHRVHGVADPFAGLEAVHVVRVQMPIGHPVIEQDPCVSGDEAGTQGALDALE